MYIFLLMFLTVMCLMAILGGINMFLLEKGYSFSMREEITSYECGFEHNSLSRVPFSVRYFLLTVIFLIFDLEIVLLVFSPFILSSSVSSLLVMVIMMFVMCLYLGLMYEMIDGSLEWLM